MNNKIILWARGDLFPGGVLGKEEESTSDAGEEFFIGDLPVK
jgi:hypothetical protein